MGLFRNREARPHADAERLASLEADVRAVRRDIADLDERFVAWMRRAEKRARDAAASPDLTEAGNPTSRTGPASGLVHGPLPDPVRRILERRNRGLPARLHDGDG